MTGRYWKGTKPIPDTCWLVETVDRKTDSFKKVGKVSVSGKLVAHEMDVHRSIKDYMPSDIAKKVARRKFPKTNPIIVSEIRCGRKKHAR